MWVIHTSIFARSLFSSFLKISLPISLWCRNWNHAINLNVVNISLSSFNHLTEWKFLVNLWKSYSNKSRSVDIYIFFDAVLSKLDLLELLAAQLFALETFPIPNLPVEFSRHSVTNIISIHTNVVFFSSAVSPFLSFCIFSILIYCWFCIFTCKLSAFTCVKIQINFLLIVYRVNLK